MYRPRHIAERQLSRIDALASEWSGELVGGIPLGVVAAVSELKRKDGEGDDDAADSLLEALYRQLEHALSLEGGATRYEDYLRANPAMEFSEEMSFLKAEGALCRSLSQRIGDLGDARFDAVLDAWERLDARKAARFGVDYGLRRTLALLVPVAREILSLISGTKTAAEIVSAYAEPEPDEEQGRRFG